VLIALVPVVPIMIWEEIAGRYGTFPLHTKGSFSLPAMYGIWSIAFIAAKARSKASPILDGRKVSPDFIVRYGISPREGELLGLLLGGASYKEIMSALTISMPTVKSHVASLYRKTGAANRLELARKIADEAPGIAGEDGLRRGVRPSHTKKRDRRE
jgi:DNA-binding CsgD family transcriptional regulator